MQSFELIFAIIFTGHFLQKHDYNKPRYSILLLLLLLHHLYSANFEDRVGGAGVARWRT